MRRSALVLVQLASLCFLAACPLSSASRAAGTDELLGDVARSQSAGAGRQGGSPQVAALGPGDVFAVRVFEEDSLSGTFRVGTDGHIDYPLCGRVLVAGLGASGAAATLSECLRAGYLRDPQVSVFVQEQLSRQVFVFGQVNKPGTFEYRDGMTVVEAITRAEGFSKLAAKNAVVITRVVDGRERRLRIPVEDIGVGRASNFVLEPGDIIFVPESFF